MFGDSPSSEQNSLMKAALYTHPDAVGGADRHGAPPAELAVRVRPQPGVLLGERRAEAEDVRARSEVAELLAFRNQERHVRLELTRVFDERSTDRLEVGAHQHVDALAFDEPPDLHLEVLGSRPGRNRRTA